ncbi:MAG: GNAT family N-acetyltransferase [Leptolyngbya sp. SIO3F4]|nr:GNAT family N-acetyltransferase [Leptolyngbya sp. SIO3F4]
MTRLEVTTTYLEMLSAEQINPAAPTGLTLMEALVPCPEFQRFLYTAVGGSWYWMDRLKWTYQQWLDYLSQKHIHTWVGYVQGVPAGYFELSQQTDQSTKIEYFGLIPQFIGQGHGGYLLTQALRTAWTLTNKRVWVHTNSIDGPNALNNYKARGLVIYDRRQSIFDLPKSPPGPWPGSLRSNP